METHTPEDKHEWVGAIHTSSGITFDIQNPTVDMVRFQDIVRALSLQCRYNGQIPSFYSVAEHSLYVSDWLIHRGQEPLALAGLMHDAAEAYIGDLVRPMKNMPELGGLFKELEQNIELVIGEKFGVQLYPMHPAVKSADKAVYEWEVKYIRTGKISGVTWRQAYGKFSERFNELF